MQPKTLPELNKVAVVVPGITEKTAERIRKNLFAALRKFGSSRKTRAVHRMIDRNLVHYGIFASEDNAMIGINNIKDSKFKMIVLNILEFDDSLTAHEAIKAAVKIADLNKQINQQESFVNEARLYKVQKLKETLNEQEETFLKSLDYLKSIDGLYFQWLHAMAYLTIKNESPGRAKIVTVSADILADILKKIYLQAKTRIDTEVHQLIEAMAVYFIKLYFYGESRQYTLASMKKAFSEEIIETIERTKINKFKDFGELAELFTKTELLPITKNTFDLQMVRMFGKKGYNVYIQKSLVDFMAFMANLAMPNQLFKDSYPVNEEAHKRLEDLLLNEAKKIILPD